MLRVYAEKYIALGEDFRELDTLAHLGGSEGGIVANEAWKNVDEENMRELVSLLLKVQKDCKHIGLKVCGKIAEQINKDFSARETLTWSVVGPRIAELKRCFVAELEETKCYVILPGRESFYTDDPSVFVSKETIAKFPGITFDITEAGKSFATERFTASVSHLVKVAEYAFVSFVRYAKLPKDMESNWNKGLNAIHENIKNKKLRSTVCRMAKKNISLVWKDICVLLKQRGETRHLIFQLFSWSLKQEASSR